jgi:hypothetical protein
MSSEGFLEELKKQQDGPEFDPIPGEERRVPVDPTHPHYGEASGNLVWQQSQENQAKESIRGEIQDLTAYLTNEEQKYDDYLIITAMQITQAIPGVEYESYEDYEAHVDRVLAKIKANRS